MMVTGLFFGSENTPARPLGFVVSRRVLCARSVLNSCPVCVFDGEGGVGVGGDASGEGMEGCCVEGDDAVEVGDGGGEGVELCLKWGAVLAWCFSPDIAAVPWYYCRNHSARPNQFGWEWAGSLFCGF